MPSRSPTHHPHRSVAEALAAARRRVVVVQALAMLALLIVALLPLRGHAAESAAAAPALGPAPLPQRLSETGLYVPGSASVVRGDNHAFAPQYPLWTDGATKRRWIHLPPGTRIDASDPDAWQFPPGTRLWKEFAHAGRAIETRLIERLPDGAWRYATYVWNLQGDDALLAPQRGVRSLPAPGAPGGLYAVPSRGDCRVCHEGSGGAPVLGFSALQLARERDPQAPHAEPLPPQALDLDGLLARGWLQLPLPPALAGRQPPPRVAARDATARAALGYLHANCGHCHNDTGPLAAMQLSLRQSVADAPASAARTWRSLYGQSSRFRGDRGDRGAEDHAPQQQALRVAPGQVDDSTLLLRMLSPHAMHRMPPIGVSVVDAAGIRLVRQWILDTDASTTQEKLP